jgi:hypothetical protein
MLMSESTPAEPAATAGGELVGWLLGFEVLGVVRRAIPDRGRLLVVEEVLAPPNQPGGKVMDLLMAAVGGRERTEPEWRALLASGDFQAGQR